MFLNELKPADGAKTKKFRKGRGHGSGPRPSEVRSGCREPVPGCPRSRG